ncbi:hypothetical protein AGLY_008729 [Aphis glycines]|uniref:Uncharacterized protein n=1 Tax=Aphis glycines TaxID=307491 RepID=A0A6G0TJF2_APHGL|nr:hypothetical protein AGLY_008729 [Aphis glycines]
MVRATCYDILVNNINMEAYRWRFLRCEMRFIKLAIEQNLVLELNFHSITINGLLLILRLDNDFSVILIIPKVEGSFKPCPVLKRVVKENDNAFLIDVDHTYVQSTLNNLNFDTLNIRSTHFKPSLNINKRLIANRFKRIKKLFEILENTSVVVNNMQKKCEIEKNKVIESLIFLMSRFTDCLLSDVLLLIFFEMSSLLFRNDVLDLNFSSSLLENGQSKFLILLSPKILKSLYYKQLLNHIVLQIVVVQKLKCVHLFLLIQQVLIRIQLLIKCFNFEPFSVETSGSHNNFSLFIINDTFFVQNQEPQLP